MRRVVGYRRERRLVHPKFFADEFGAFDRSFRRLPPAQATGYMVQRIDRTERVDTVFQCGSASIRQDRALWWS
ncbi:hypothetical protein ACFZBU_16655 [Embleya sp. NPDC008237]|uniref:hypothetical protein n=1 Tax=Embleya sp. NPDC008237 TaxID=3363978 RepID=UPI0036ED3E67